jgi:hypothetical protein
MASLTKKETQKMACGESLELDRIPRATNALDVSMNQQ